MHTPNDESHVHPSALVHVGKVAIGQSWNCAPVHVALFATQFSVFKHMIYTHPHCCNLSSILIALYHDSCC